MIKTLEHPWLLTWLFCTITTGCGGSPTPTLNAAAACCWASSASFRGTRYNGTVLRSTLVAPTSCDRPVLGVAPSVVLDPPDAASPAFSERSAPSTWLPSSSPPWRVLLAEEKASAAAVPGAGTGKVAALVISTFTSSWIRFTRVYGSL